MIGSISRYIGQGELTRSWLVYYYFMPAEGAVLGIATFLVFCSGFDAAANGAANSAISNSSDPFYIFALAFVAGAFAKNALGMLKRIADAVFGPPSTYEALSPEKKGKG